MKIASLIINRIIPSGESVTSTRNRSKVGIFQGYVSVIGNFILFILKLFLGLSSASMALVADAFHTLSDVISSGIVIFGFHIAGKPADQEHPFGHGRAETIAALSVALLIGFVGLEFIKIGINRLLDPEIIHGNWIWVSAIIITIIVKEFMARFAYELGEIIHSDTLKADALHHKSDSYSSILTIVAMIGGMYGVDWLDGAMAIGVAGFMLYAGYEIAVDAINDLLGTTESPEMIQTIKDTAMKVENVHNVHDIIVHRYGNYVFISLHLEVDNLINSDEMHFIADTVEKNIADHLNAQVVTHVDPITVTGEDVSKIRDISHDLLNSYGIKENLHDLRIVRDKEVESIIFEIPVSTEFNDRENLDEELKRLLGNEFPSSNIVIDYKIKFN